MNIKLLCVGKLKERYFEDACDEFCKRLSRFCTLQIIEVPDEKAADSFSSAQEEQVKEKEGQRLLSKLDPKDYLVALTLDGAAPTSEKLASQIGRYRDEGKSLAFVIGGSLGLSPAVIARANAKLCLSNLTLPHRIARLFLLEQLYRSFKILSGETYHK